MTTTQVAKQTGAQTLRANAQQAKVCALGANGKCAFCDREGIPILPLRYAVIPNVLRERVVLPLEQAHPMLNKGLLQHQLKGHKYTLRTLRAGFVHVYLGRPGLWQIYAVTTDGLLRLLADPDDPDQKTDREMTDACKRDGHNLPASFIHIPYEYAKAKIWIAFSQNAWQKSVRAKREAAPAERMQAIDCAALASNPDHHPHAFDLTGTYKPSGPNAALKPKLHLLVDEYAKDGTEAIFRRRYAWQRATGEVAERARGFSQRARVL